MGSLWLSALFFVVPCEDVEGVVSRGWTVVRTRWGEEAGQLYVYDGERREQGRDCMCSCCSWYSGHVSRFCTYTVICERGGGIQE